MLKKSDFIGIIPARYGSTRFPGKPLAVIGGLTMIERVYRQALKALDRVVVATDDDRIFDAVMKFGGEVVMTSPDCPNGTMRVYEAYKSLGASAKIVINIQGDEPFIQPEQISAVMHLFIGSQGHKSELLPISLTRRWDLTLSLIQTGSR